MEEWEERMLQGYERVDAATGLKERTKRQKEEKIKR